MPGGAATAHRLTGIPVHGAGREPAVHGGSAAPGHAGSAPVQMVRDGNEERHARNVEAETRRQVPAAANQESDLRRDPDALARHELTRYMSGRALGTDPGQSDTPQNPRNTLGTAMSADRYHGGMCNEYSALAFAHHMMSPQASQEPIVRYWNPDMGHSFTSVGDARDPTMQPYVADGWTTHRDPVYMHDSLMAQGRNNVVAQWTDRMPGEGHQVVNQAHQEATNLFQTAEANPFTIAEGNRRMNQARQDQQTTLFDINRNNRPGWIWEHTSNRR